ncbi:putative reverse transcriptase domain-containing protein [Tanacetum coccineum]
MPPRMMTRSTGQPAAESQGGGMGGRAGRDRGRVTEPRRRNVNPTNLLPTILAQVGNHGNNQENIVNENVQGDVRNVIVNNDRRGCTYKEFLACNLKEYDGKGGAIGFTRWIKKKESVQDMSGCGDNQKAAVGMACEDFKTLMRVAFCPSNKMQKLETKLWNLAMVGAGHAAYTNRFHELARLVLHLVTPKNKKIEMYLAGALTDEALRNGFIKKNLEKRGNVGEPSNDMNVRDDNKRTRTGNSFATTANPVGRENMGTIPKCATCNSYHAPKVPCRTCFNCNHPGYFAKDCRVMPRNVNLVNVRNPSPACEACYKCKSTDHIKSACHRNQGNQAREGNSCWEHYTKGTLQDPNIMTGERPDEKVRHLRSAKAKEQKLGDFAVVRNFPKVFPDDLAGLPPI